jgi:hypothetical protein
MTAPPQCSINYMKPFTLSGVTNFGGGPLLLVPGYAVLSHGG